MLQEAKVAYQREMTEARRKLYKMYKIHRSAIEKSKPFFVAKELEKQVGLRSQSRIQHGWLSTFIIKCGMNLLILSQLQRCNPLKFGMDK